MTDNPIIEAATGRLRQELRRFLDNVPDELTVRDPREALQPGPGHARERRHER